jgi:hypothetical protein
VSETQAAYQNESDKDSIKQVSGLQTPSVPVSGSEEV